MIKIISRLLPFAVFSLWGCEALPEHASATGPYRFYSVLAVEHWTQNRASQVAAEPNFQTSSQAAVVTWRIGKDAPLPRAWAADDHCMVFEGSWRDTEFSPPSHGKVTLTVASKSSDMGEGRTAVGLEMQPNDLKAGTSVAASAPGEGLPAFSFSSTLGPQLSPTSHPLATAALDQIHLVRTAPLVVTWDAVDGEVELSVMQYTKDTDQELLRSIWCHWPGSAATATVPAIAVDELIESSAVSMSTMYFGSLARELKTIEQADVELWMWNGYGSRILVE